MPVRHLDVATWLAKRVDSGREQYWERIVFRCSQAIAVTRMAVCDFWYSLQNNETRRLSMIGKHSKLILAVASVFIFALSLTVSITSSANACVECCIAYCPPHLGGGWWQGYWTGTQCNYAFPPHCCHNPNQTCNPFE
jgi:hypothetical protein